VICWYDRTSLCEYVLMNFKPLEDMQLSKIEGRKEQYSSNQADKLQKHVPIVLLFPCGGNDARDVQCSWRN